MASTYLQLVNKVLRRLRETEVASVTENTYSTLIGEFVNQAKREVEEAWTWHRLRTTVSITTANGTSSYTLTGAGDRFRLLHDPYTGRPDVINTTSDYYLHQAPSTAWMRQRQLLGTQQNGQPLYFNFNSYSSDDPLVDLWPVPTATETISFSMYIPQADLSTGSTTIVVPEEPVILRAWSLAISERGEDQGSISNEVDRQYFESLGNAVSADTALTSEDLVWRVE